MSDEHYAASALLGLVRPDYMPEDERLRAIVAAVAVAGPGVDAVLPVLREMDPSWDWCAHVVYLLEAWDERVTRAKEMAHAELWLRAIVWQDEVRRRYEAATAQVQAAADAMRAA